LRFWKYQYIIREYKTRGLLLASRVSVYVCRSRVVRMSRHTVCIFFVNLVKFL